MQEIGKNENNGDTKLNLWQNIRNTEIHTLSLIIITIILFEHLTSL